MSYTNNTDCSGVDLRDCRQRAVSAAGSYMSDACGPRLTPGSAGGATIYISNVSPCVLNPSIYRGKVLFYWESCRRNEKGTA